MFVQSVQEHIKENNAVQDKSLYASLYVQGKQPNSNENLENSDPIVLSEKVWLDQFLIKSDSKRTRGLAKTSLNMFRCYCKHEGINEEGLIKKYQALTEKGDIGSICLSLMGFIQFLNKDIDSIILNENSAPVKFKKKHPTTIQNYFNFIKSYLRLCYRIRISTLDIKDYMKFPKVRKEARRAMPIKVIKLIFSIADPIRKALYSVLLSSGVRIGEAVQLRKKDFHFNENPVRISLKADITKTKEARDSYISREAVDKLLPLIEGKKDDECVFTDIIDGPKKYSDEDLIHKAVVCEDQYFRNLRKRLGLTERYDNSRNFIHTLHNMRGYFHTKASRKHGSDYANAMDGHGSYLKQYYQLPIEERAKMYKELEPTLLIESFNPQLDKTKDKMIDDLKAQVEKIQVSMNRHNLFE